MARGIDYAGGRPSGAGIRAAGFDFACRYLSDGGSSLPGKLLLPWEADDLRANGVEIVSNWETTADRALAGWDAGVYDAQRALDVVLSRGGRRDRPIYFSVDFDATEAQQGPINDYLHGAGTIIPGFVGVYGGYWVVKRALDSGAATWAWQTIAWSGGNVDPRINIMQHNEWGYAYVEGVEGDYDVSLTDDYGQWSWQYPQPPQGVFVTPEEKAAFDQLVADVKEIRAQLGGDGGWPELGQNAAGQNLSLVDAVAAIKDAVLPKKA